MVDFRSAGGGNTPASDGRAPHSGATEAAGEVCEPGAAASFQRVRPHSAHATTDRHRSQQAADARRSLPAKVSTRDALQLQAKALRVGARAFVPAPERRAFIPEQRALGVGARNTNDDWGRGRSGPVAAWMERPRAGQDHAVGVNAANEAIWRASMRLPFANAAPHPSVRRSAHAEQRGTAMGAPPHPANALRHLGSYNRSHAHADVAVAVPGMAILVKRLPDDMVLDPWRAIDCYTG
jgi:hypothetical protein